MNYKSLILAAMAGLTLASCVKDVESPEVGEIRDAKLEQIQSATDLNKAQAAAIAKLADAEAALMAAQTEAEQAQAAYLKAQTELVKAQTEGQNIANEKALAELEAALLEAQLRKEKAQAALERLALETERALIEAQQQLLNAKRNYANSKNGYLTTLANSYANAVMTLNEAQSYLITLKGYLASAEQQLTPNLNETREKQVLYYNRMIAREEAYLAYLKENLNLNEEERAAKIDELLDAAEELYVVYKEKNDLYLSLLNERNNKRTMANIYVDYSSDSPINTPVEVWSVDNYYYFNGAIQSKTNIENETIHSYSYNDVENKDQLIAFAKGNKQRVQKNMKSEDGEYSFWYNEYSHITVTDAEAVKVVAEAGKAKIAKEHETAVKNINSDIAISDKNIEMLNSEIAKYDAKTAEYKAELKKQNAAYEEADAKYAEAFQAVLAYLNEVDSEVATALAVKNDADNKVTSIEGNIATLKSNITYLKGTIAADEETVAQTSKKVADEMPDLKKALEAAQKADAEAKAAVEKKEAEVAELKKAMDEAYAAYWQKHLENLAGKVEDATEVTKLHDAYIEAQGKYNTADGELTSLKGEASTAATALTAAEDAVKTLNDSLATAEKTLADNKKALADYEAKLAKAEAELEAAKVVAEEANAAYEKAAAYYSKDEKYIALSNANIDAWSVRDEISQKRYSIYASIDSIENTEIEYVRILASPTSYYFYNNVNYATLVWLLSTQKSNKESYEENLVKAEKNFADFNEKMDKKVEDIISYAEDVEEQSKYFAEQNELEIKTAEAYLAQAPANTEYNKVTTEISALEAEAEAAVANIKKAEENIEYYKKQIEQWLETTADEQIVANLKAEIAAYEKLIEAYTIAADEAKAALDAALAEYAEDVE